MTRTSVFTFGPHKILQTPPVGSGTRLSQTRRVIPRKDVAYSCFGRTTVPTHIGIYQVADVVGHRRGRGRHSPHNYIYCLRVKGFDPEADLEYRAHQVPQCQELIAAYRAQHQLETITPPPCKKRKHPALKDGTSPGSDAAPEDGSPLESESIIRKRPCNKRKHLASKDGNPPGSDNRPVAIRHRKTVITPVAMLHQKTVIPSVAMLHRRTVIPSVAMPHWKTVVPSNANPLFASANPDLARIKRKIIRRGESE